MIKLPKVFKTSPKRLVSKLRALPLVIAVFLIAMPHIPQSILKGTPAYANLSQQEIDDLNAKLKDTQSKLASIKSQKEQVTKQITGEQNNQSKLAGDAKYIDNVLLQNELQVEGLKLEIYQLDIEVQILTKEKEQKEANLKDIQGKIAGLDSELTASMNLLYKMSLSSPNFLEKNSNFEDSVVGEEKQKSLIRIVKTNILEVKKLEQEVQSKKDEIAAKEKETSDLKGEKQAQTDSLLANQKGLAWQKQNKLSLLDQSKKKAAFLSTQKTGIEQQIGQFEADLSVLKNSLYIATPSGSPIAAGGYIGLEGRTGLSCDWGLPDTLPANYINYCSYLGSNWYYYPLDKYPTKGAHLHFEYRLKGANSNVDPSKYYDQFIRMPMDNMTISQGFSGSHNAIDIVGGYGQVVRSVKAGKIIYRCDLFPPDPAYGAVVYHDDGTITQYWHLQRPGGVKC